MAKGMAFNLRWAILFLFFLGFIFEINSKNYLLAAVIFAIGSLVVKFVFDPATTLSILFLLSSDFGLKEIKKIGKSKIFEDIIEIGYILAFGMSAFLFKKFRKVHLLGFLVLLLLYNSLPLLQMAFMVAFKSSYYLDMQVSGALNKTGEAARNFPLDAIVEYGIPIAFFAFGMFGFAFLSLWIGAVEIILLAKSGGRPPAGITIALPGYNIPLVSGIIALFITLLVHEGAHGALSVFHKIKLKSLGLLTIGIIPIGAFTESDEKQFKKAKKESQIDVLLGGVTLNLLSAVAFSFLLLGLLNLNPETSVVVLHPLNSSLIQNSVLVRFGNFSISSFESLEKAEKYYLSKNISRVEIELYTSNGSITKTITTKNGKIGALFSEEIKDPAFKWVFTLTSLCFLLNFLFGVSNLIALPGMDGYKVLESVLDKSKFDVIKYLTYIALLVNILPIFL